MLMIARGAAGAETIRALGIEPDRGGRGINYILYMTLGPCEPCEPGDLSSPAAAPGHLMVGVVDGHRRGRRRGRHC